MEPRRGGLSARTLPCDCGENRRIKGVWMCLGEKLERRERGYVRKEGFGSTYSGILTHLLLAAIQCALATSTNISSFGFF